MPRRKSSRPPATGAVPGREGAKPPAGDASVEAATGRTWAQWFALLDAAGAHEKPHRDIVAILSREHGVGPWWRQMITVGYERARGLRAVHETPDGFAVGASRTIEAEVEALFDAWVDVADRRRWLEGTQFTVRRSTRPKSLRITWEDGSHVDATFTTKGAGKSTVHVDHRKLNSKDVPHVKAFWRQRLDALKAHFEK